MTTTQGHNAGHFTPAHTLPSEPSSLCAAAGSASLRVRGTRIDRRRRGSFLVLVVGTLALIAIITIVFVSLGSQDARTRSAVEARSRFDTVPPQIADHILGIVASDAVATKVDIVTSELNAGLAGDLPQILTRETTDAPGTRYDVLTFAGAQTGIAFNPEGTAPKNFDSSVPAPVAPSDPFLASSAAIALDPDPATALARPDWPFISNIAPDGAFVNLSALRGNRPFDVESATLRQLVPSTNDFINPPSGAPVIPLNQQLTRPAVFSNRQIGMHRPAAVGGSVDWTDPAMKLNEWADADGDGWLDARWFEMKREIAGGEYADEISSNDRRTRYFFAARIIDLSGRVNVHTATDIMAGPRPDFPLGLTPADVDLRRLLMLKDATNEQARWSTFTIADLTRNDPNPALSLPDWPLGSAASANYDQEAGLFLGDRSYIAAKLSTQLGIPLPRTFRGDIVAADPSIEAIELEYKLAPRVPSLYATPAPAASDDVGAEWRSFFSYDPSAAFPTFTTPPQLLAFAAARDAAGRARINHYARVTGLRADGNFIRPAAPVLPVSASAGLPFGVPDLAELLERNGVNSDRTSALESALGGRDDVTNPSLDPLRSNRPSDIELRVADFDADRNGDTPFEQAELLQSLDVRSRITTLSGARQLRPVLLSDRATDATKLSEALDESENKIDAIAALSNQLYADLPLPTAPGPAGAVLPPTFDPALYRIFDGYAAALAPYSVLTGENGTTVNAWDYTTGGALPGTPSLQGDAVNTATLFYGHRGPHVAMQIAAHMTANLADMVDSDSEPTVVTVEFARDYVENNLDPGTASEPPLSGAGSTGIGLPENTEAEDLVPGWFAMDQRAGGTGIFTEREADASYGTALEGSVIANTRLTYAVGTAPRIADQRITPDPAQTVAPVMNVYGIEPQAFLTQVGTVAVYWDDDAGLTTANDGPSGEVHIKGDVNVDNTELLYRAVILQISNPFDKPVRLSDAPYSEALRLDSGDPGRVIPDPLTTADVPNPGSFVPMNDLVAREYTAARMGSFYYVDIGDTQIPSTAPAAQLALRGKRFVLASLKEQVFGSVVVPERPQALNPASDGRFARELGDPDAPAIATLEGIVVPPGETVTCVALSVPPSEAYRRIALKDTSLAAAIGVGAPQGDERDRIMRVLARQWSSSLWQNATAPNADGDLKLQNIHWIPQIDVETSEFLGYSTPGTSEFVDVIPKTPPVGTAQYASMWRTVRGPKERQPDVLERVFAPSDPDATKYLPEDVTNTAARVSIVPTNADPAALRLVKRNNFENDQLVDRMLLVTSSPVNVSGTPQRVDLDVRLPSRDVEIDGSTTDGTNASLTLVADDELTLTLSAWVRRPADGEAALNAGGGVLDTDLTTGVPKGVLPAWALEPKYFFADQSWNAAYRTARTAIDTQLGPTGTIDVGDFADDTTASFTGYVKSVSAWRREMDGTPATPGVATRLVEPTGDALLGEDWVGNGDLPQLPPNQVVAFRGAVLALANQEQIDIDNAGLRVSALNSIANPFRFDETRMQVFETTRPDRRSTVNVMRLTDLLLPAGIGPFSAPYDRFSAASPPTRSQNYYDPVVGRGPFLARHTTLGEAVAEVLGYSVSAISEAATAAGGFEAGNRDPAIWLNAATGTANFNIVDTDTTTRTDETLFDGINLALDRFTPFIDLNGNGERDVGPGLSEPGAMSEMPFAQAVLDQFMIAPPTTPDPVLAGGLVRAQIPLRPVVSSLTRAQPGLVNINTASIEVLRTLPGVAPIFGQGASNANSEYDWSRAQYKFDASVAAPTATQIGVETDLAPAMEAYRTMGGALIRTPTLSSAVWSDVVADYNTATSESDRVLLLGRPQDMFDDALLAGAAAAQPPRATEVALKANQVETSTVDRTMFRGVGEVLSARVRQTSTVPALKGLPINPDGLGNNSSYGRDTGGVALPLDSSFPNVSTFVANTSGSGVPNAPIGSGDGVPNGYDEKLALVGSFANTITTRSDYFAAWFVVHGYREEDTLDLQPTQPLIPSVKRRFLMIMDRSEVTRLGQKPKVLLMQEVPYEFPAKQ